MNHCKTIAIVNQKGGVGKTTSTVNLGVGLAQAGNRVLLVDDDPQHSLTISLGIRNADDDLDTTLATAMQAEIRDESVSWEEGIIHSGEGVDLLPANIELSGVEMSLFNAMSREQVLKSVLSRVKENYDYILIDCMPSLGLMSINIFLAQCVGNILCQRNGIDGKSLAVSQLPQKYAEMEPKHLREELKSIRTAANQISAEMFRFLDAKNHGSRQRDDAR